MRVKRVNHRRRKLSKLNSRTRTPEALLTHASTAKTKAKVPAKPKGGAKKGVARKKAAVRSEKEAEEDSDGEVGEVQDGVADVKGDEESV
jgi:hypothetical protein